jgi:hypothetical protein
MSRVYEQLLTALNFPLAGWVCLVPCDVTGAVALVLM